MCLLSPKLVKTSKSQDTGEGLPLIAMFDCLDTYPQLSTSDCQYGSASAVLELYTYC